jgi:hypothetical protein
VSHDRLGVRNAGIVEDNVQTAESIDGLFYAIASTKAVPNPLAAPVTIATLPLKSNIFGYCTFSSVLCFKA